MAKKTVASLQSKTSKLTKVFKMVKSSKTGAYAFESRVMSPDLVDGFLKSKSKK